MRTVLGVLSLIWKLYLAIVFTITALFYYPFIFLLLQNEKTKKAAFYFFVIWGWTFRILCMYFVKIESNGPIPDEPYIVIANHASYLDIFLMYTIMFKRPFIFLGKSEILKYPLIKTFFKKLNVPVYRDSRIKAAKALVIAAKEIHKGWSVVIFPEGGIPDSDNPKMIPFKGGAFQLAKSAAVPIVPISFTNNHLLFSDPTNILGPARPGLSRVHIHPIITKEEVIESTQFELAAKCFEIINEPILERHPHLRD